MDKYRSAPASTTTLTRALVVGAFVCVGGSLTALLLGLSAPIASAAMTAAAMLAASAALSEYRRARSTAHSPLEDVPDGLIPAPLSENGESWVGVDAARATQMIRLLRIAYAAPFAPLVLWIWVRHAILNPTLPIGTRMAGRLLEIMTVVMLLTCVIAILFTRQRVKRALQSRIGANATHLLYNSGTGKVERYEWSSVLADSHQLLIGRRILARTRPMFSAEGLSAVVLARLPRASFIGHTRFQLTALRRGNPLLWLMFAPLVPMAILQLMRKLHPEWFTAASEAFVVWLRMSVS